MIKKKVVGIVLFAIVGELGSGKTLTLTYLAWHNWLHRGRRIYSNLTLYGFPFTKVTSVDDLDRMREGFGAFDELWLSISSWSRSKKIEFITSILLKSRKRGLTICFTTQSISQINKRIREVTDFLAYALMSVDNSYCRVEIFRGPKPSIGTRMKPPIYFNVEPVIAMYNTYEEVKPLIPKEEAEKLNLPVSEEVFIPITQNPAWIRYLRSKGIRTKDRILKYSQKIMKVINPEGITSEDQREHEDFEVV